MLPPNAEARAAFLEQALSAAVTKVRDPSGEVWAVSIDPADINAWLAMRLPKWIAHDPSLEDLEPLTALRVRTAPGTILVERAVGPLIATLRLDIALGASGLRPAIGAARVGRLPLPGLAALIGARALEARFAGAASLATSDPAQPATLSLADGRRVQLVAIAIREGAIQLAFKTTLGHATRTSPATPAPAP
ncbi:MAG: hypothetical protein ACKOYN_09905 [Planctomycetota bacterium]